MHDARGVRRVEPEAHLAQHRQHAPDAHALVLAQVVGEVPAPRRSIARYGTLGVRRGDLEDAHDVGGVQRRHDACLAHEALHEVGLRQHVRVQELDRGGPVVGLRRTASYTSPIGAAPDDPAEAEVSEHLVGPAPVAPGLEGLRELVPRLAQQGVTLRERADDPSCSSIAASVARRVLRCKRYVARKMPCTRMSVVALSGVESASPRTSPGSATTLPRTRPESRA